MATRRRSKRTQEERSATMRNRLLQATVDCLVDHGYAGTSTTAVIERAGVSRGAILHHFPTKADLVATAVEFILEKRNEAFAASFAEIAKDESLIDGVIFALWKEISGPTFYAWLELLVAARTDPVLRKKVVPISQRWADSVDLTFRSIFGLDRDPGHHPLALAPIVTFMMMEGLALERIARNDDGTLEKRVIKALKAMAPLAALTAVPATDTNE